MQALHDIVRSGKALYAGISNYNARQTELAVAELRRMGTHLLIHQPNYSMLDRWIEDGLTDVLRREGVGCIVFSPLERGLLSNRYLHGIPQDSRVSRDPRYMTVAEVTDEKKLALIRKLDELAQQRGQSLAQMALSWTLRDAVVTSVLFGASNPGQIVENIDALKAPAFSREELDRIADCL